MNTQTFLIIYITRISGPYGPLKILAPADSMFDSLTKNVRFAHIYLFINIIIAAPPPRYKIFLLEAVVAMMMLMKR